MNFEKNGFPDNCSAFCNKHTKLSYCSTEMLLVLENISFENILRFKDIFFQLVPIKVTIAKDFA